MKVILGNFIDGTWVQEGGDSGVGIFLGLSYFLFRLYIIHLIFGIFIIGVIF